MQPFSILMHYFIILVFLCARGVVAQTVEQGAWKVSLCGFFVCFNSVYSLSLFCIAPICNKHNLKAMYNNIYIRYITN